MRSQRTYNPAIKKEREYTLTSIVATDRGGAVQNCVSKKSHFGGFAPVYYPAIDHRNLETL